MKRPIQILIPKPCSEDWRQMTPADRGRHCAACQKTVVDFTQLSDAEVLDLLRSSPQNACGRFRMSQVGRPLTQPSVPETSPWQKLALKLAASLLTLHLAASGAFAQAPLRQNHHQQTSRTPVRNRPQFLSGQLLDSLSGAPVVGVELELRGMGQAAVTDEKGRFTLRYPDSASGSLLTLGCTDRQKAGLQATRYLIDDRALGKNGTAYPRHIVLYGTVVFNAADTVEIIGKKVVQNPAGNNSTVPKDVEIMGAYISAEQLSTRPNLSFTRDRVTYPPPAEKNPADRKPKKKKR